MAIKYHKISIFDAPLGSTLVHAVNCQGQFRSGIAAAIKEKYPEVYEEYKEECERTHPMFLLGDAGIFQTNDENYFIGNLFTSIQESQNKDSEEDILISTTLAVDDFLLQNDINFDMKSIYSVKINSGHFGVPWEKTAKIIEVLSNRYDVEWNVCDPNLEE
jgi:ADP-ribose 1''-phosphate phosphatase